MNTTTSLSWNENNNLAVGTLRNSIKAPQKRVISRHFRENVFLVTGKQNFRTDRDVYIIAVTSNLLEDLRDLREETNRIKFKIRHLENHANIHNFAKKKYLPRFQDDKSTIASSHDWNNSDDEDTNTVISSQHFVNIDARACSIHFKTQKSEIGCRVAPLAHFSPRWSPPRSPHALIEEEFSENPWALLVATIFLTKTTGLKAKPLLWRFLRDFPDPISVAWADVKDLEVYFKTLGLVKRASMIQKMSREFLEGKWRKAGDLCGIGQYGEDAYRIFCLGETNFEPCDRYLRLYVDWLNRRDFNEDFGC